MNRIKQISTLVFLIYFLGVSIGTTLNLHYCSGKVVDFAFFSNDISCQMHTAKSCDANTCSINSISYNHLSEKIPQCCEDKSIDIALNSETLVQSLKIFNFDSILDINSINIALFNINQNIFIEKNIEEPDKLPAYPPPFILFQQLLVYS